MPRLRVVALESLRRHEETDPRRVESLIRRLEAEQTQGNPMLCAEAPSGELVLLDGATRTEALSALGLTHAVVQVVDPSDVTLETWHHVVRRCPPEELVEAVESRKELNLAAGTTAPLLRLAGGATMAVEGHRVSPNATIHALVHSYLGRWEVSRVADPRLKTVSWRFTDWSAVVEFPPLTVEEVMKAALSEDFLPAGVTRFLVPGRVLGLNLELARLRQGTLEAKQEAVDSLLRTRARQGRIRRYEEPVIVLDD